MAAANCPQCGAPMNAGTCTYCGFTEAPQQQMYQQQQPMYQQPQQVNVAYGPMASPKSKMTALLLCLFVGGLGIHHFYVGKTGMGILYIFTAGLFGIGVIIDLIMIIMGNFKDSQGLLLTN